MVCRIRSLSCGVLSFVSCYFRYSWHFHQLRVSSSLGATHYNKFLWWGLKASKPGAGGFWMAWVARDRDVAGASCGVLMCAWVTQASITGLSGIIIMWWRWQWWWWWCWYGKQNEDMTLGRRYVSILSGLNWRGRVGLEFDQNTLYLCIKASKIKLIF